jgi:hypothetical protein
MSAEEKCPRCGSTRKEVYYAVDIYSDNVCSWRNHDPWHDSPAKAPQARFHIDDSPNGERFFISGDLVTREEFLRRRIVECQHRFTGVPSDLCVDCGIKAQAAAASAAEPLCRFYDGETGTLCGKPENHTVHAKYGNDLDVSWKHLFDPDTELASRDRTVAELQATLEKCRHVIFWLKPIPDGEKDTHIEGFPEQYNANLKSAVIALERQERKSHISEMDDARKLIERLMGALNLLQGAARRLDFTDDSGLAKTFDARIKMADALLSECRERGYGVKK